MGVPQNKAFRRENLTKMNDFGVPLFQETPIYIYIYISIKPMQGNIPRNYLANICAAVAQ